MNSKYVRWLLFITCLLVLVVAAILFSLSTGEMSISVFDIPEILNDKSSLEYTIMFNLRLPRLILGFAVGGALSLSGAVFQGIYRNPLVEPFTLGVSGGAAFCVALSIVWDLNAMFGYITLPASGFIGAVTTVFLVYFLSVRRGSININRMLLIGVMISFVASSAMMFLMSTTTTQNLHSIVFWIMGSLDEQNTMLIKIVFFSAIAGLISTYFFARPLNALRLGENKARHLGVNSLLAIRMLFIIASLLTGICVAVTGVIGFVGLVIPHLMRKIIGTDFRVLLISSFLGGSIFIIICDVISKTIVAPNELPIGVITGMTGGLVFILVLSKKGVQS